MAIFHCKFQRSFKIGSTVYDQLKHYLTVDCITTANITDKLENLADPELSLNPYLKI